MKKAICEFCGKEYEYDENNIRVREEGRKDSYDSSRFCCFHCFSKERVRKQKETLSKRLGYKVTSTFHLPGVQEKAQATSLKRYGTKFGVCSKQSVEKRRKTCKERYGVEVPLQNKEIKQKTYDSNIKNHNGTYHLQTEEVREKCAEGHRTDEYREKARRLFDAKSKHTEFVEKYGVSNPFQLEFVKEKSKETLLKKYGVENISKDVCTLEKRSNTRMLNEAINVDNLTKEYLEENFVKEEKFQLREASEYFNVTLFAMDSFKQQLGVEYQNEEKRNNTLETEFFNFISSLTDKEIIRNTRSVISPLELDIYIPTMNLAFEFNGDYWHSENFGRSKFYHIEKTKQCEKKGIRLIHIWEHEWLKNDEKIKLFIKSLFVKREKIRASQCVIKDLSTEEFDKFADKYHLLGATSTTAVKFGLFYDGTLVSAIGLSFDSKHEFWNLKRYIIGEYQVMGGFEKLFKYFIEKYNPDKIITFVELSKFKGDVNFKNGFVLDKELAPDFFWIINDVRVDKWTAWRQFKESDENTAEYQKKMKTFALKCYDAGKRRLIWNKS